jgi:hypothetical protein
MFSPSFHQQPGLSHTHPLLHAHVLKKLSACNLWSIFATWACMFPRAILVLMLIAAPLPACAVVACLSPIGSPCAFHARRCCPGIHHSWGVTYAPPVFLHPQQLHENTSHNTISQLIFVHHLLLNIRRPHRISERWGPHPKKPVLEPVYRPLPSTHMCVRPSAFCMTFRSYLCS